MTEIARPETPGGSPAASGGADPALGRLRALLRQEILAARDGHWASFSALATEVRAELARQAPGVAERTAVVAVAHLQRQLEQTLTAKAQGMAAHLAMRHAAAAYRRVQAAEGSGR
jgi:flagellar biosynthesis component FlhA